MDDLLRREDRLRDHAVDALGAVHHLGYMVIYGDARDHVGFLPRELRKTLSDEADSLPYRHFHCLFEVRIEPHHDPVGRGLGTWPGDFHILADDELEPATQPGLDGSQIDLAMALRSMSVADREQRAGRVDRQIERRT